MPILMLAIMAAPTFFMFLGSHDKKVVTVLDNTHEIGSRLQSNDEIEFKLSDGTPDQLRADEDNEAILVIGNNVLSDSTSTITLLSRGAIPMMTDAYITGELNRAIEDARLSHYNIPGLTDIINKSKSDISLQTVRIDKDEDTETSSELSYIIALVMDMVLYMFILIYGQMVMTSIIEEKTNRVLEIVVSSVKPFQLMLGKIVGVGLVAVTQILIWGVLIGVATSVAIPFLTPENFGGDIPTEVSGMIAQFTDPWFLISLFVFTLLFFIGGFLLYASVYAAIGSAVSNVQDASQLSSIATMPIILSIVGSMSIINDPDSTLAFWLSIIPLTSPMTMMSRMPFGVPFWETALSIVLLYISFIFMIWLCAKIYRIGIFMYGKKPTIVEIIKWARYK